MKDRLYIRPKKDYIMIIHDDVFTSYNGIFKGVIKSEAVYKCTNKDYLPDAKPSKGIYWPE